LRLRGVAHHDFSRLRRVRQPRRHRDRILQRQVLQLGELNTTQFDSWQHSIDVLHEDGQRRQLRLFIDRKQSTPNDPGVVEVKLSSFAVQSPRRFGDCWAATQRWSDLGLEAFWREALAKDAGDVPWEKAEGAYLLRAHWTERNPAKLWRTYTQLTEGQDDSRDERV